MRGRVSSLLARLPGEINGQAHQDENCRAEYGEHYRRIVRVPADGAG
jgi:hypothetical protein